MFRRQLAVSLLFLAAGCARDLDLPSSAPPRVTAVHAPGHENGEPVPGGFPALGGELVAIRGEGFGSRPDAVRVTIGAAEAEVLDAGPDRLVVRLPAVGAAGALDVGVTTPTGFGALPAGIDYLGPGAPLDNAPRSVPTTTPLRFATAVTMAPVLFPHLRSDAQLGSLAVAVGASDTALLVVGNLGVAFSTVPLGIVPVSAAARLVTLPGFDAAGGTGDVELQVLALDPAGTLGIGAIDLRLSGWKLSGPAVVSRPAAFPVVVEGFAPSGCDTPQILFTARGSAAAVAWKPSGWMLGVVDPASIDPAALSAGTATPAIRTPAVDLSAAPGAGPAGWTALDDQFIAVAVDASSGADLIRIDTNGSGTAARLAAGGTPVADLLRQAAGCGAMDAFLGVAASGAVTGNLTLAGQTLAVSYRAQQGPDLVALVGLAGGAPSCRTPGVLATALAFASAGAEYPAAPDYLLAASGSLLERFPVAASGPSPDASLSLDADPLAFSAPVGTLVPTSGGARVLAVVPAGNLVTVLPEGFTSAGPVFRLASYGSVSAVALDVAGTAGAFAVAEHTLPLSQGEAIALDTAGAALVLPLGEAETPFSMGAGVYPRGTVSLAGSGGRTILAYAGQNTGGAVGGAARFQPDACRDGLSVDVAWSTLEPPDLLTQGPARSGAFGPKGESRFGPSPAPVYGLFGTRLVALRPDAATLDCLLDPAGSWASCPGEEIVDLGSPALEVVPSAGDRTMAARRLDLSGPVCALCAGSSLCQRLLCPLAKELLLAPAGQAPVALALPSSPLAISPDRAGGYVVSVACTTSPASGAPATCFGQGEPCSDERFGIADPHGAGALLLVPEDGGAPFCLAVGQGLAGRIALTPNGAEAWVASVVQSGTRLQLTRVALTRRTTDGTIDTAAEHPVLSRRNLGRGGVYGAGYAASGVAFTPDGRQGVVTVPDEYQIAVFE
jgi:hypothetical protein